MDATSPPDTRRVPRRTQSGDGDRFYLRPSSPGNNRRRGQDEPPDVHDDLERNRVGKEGGKGEDLYVTAQTPNFPEAALTESVVQFLLFVPGLRH